MRNRSASPAFATFSFDDGAPTDLRLGSLLARHGLPATFYIPARNAEGAATLSATQILELSSMGFEIGTHGYTHRYLDLIPASEVPGEIRTGRESLEQILGRPVVAFAYPGGRAPFVAVDAVRRLGFSFARTTRELRFRAPDPLLAPTTGHIGRHTRRHYVKEALAGCDPTYWRAFAAQRLWSRDWYEIALINLEYAIAHGGTWHLWGHSAEIDRNGEWGRLERICKLVRSHVLEGTIFACINTATIGDQQRT